MTGRARDTRSVAFVWKQFAPYHVDRCAAAARALGPTSPVLGIEIAAGSSAYAWPVAPDEPSFTRVTLFPHSEVECLPARLVVSAAWRALRRQRLRAVFLCHYEHPAIAFLALRLRLCGVPVFVMFDSKFDDKPRRPGREALKRRLLWPYGGALASGMRARDYLRFLGLPRGRIALGYDTVSVARVRAEAAAKDVASPERPFLVVARCVRKKNLSTAIAAYASYRAAALQRGFVPRSLHLLGDGPLRPELEAEVAGRGLEGVRFHGFVMPETVARAMAGARALVLPSVEEQWGLVVNEALALGLPVLASTRIGAVDGLLRPGINGLLADPHDAEGFAASMSWLDADEEFWRRLSDGARDTGQAGDTERFAEGVRMLLEAPP